MHTANQSPSSAITQYLQRHASPEAQVLRAPGVSYDRVLVVPAHRENAAMVEGWADALGAAPGRALVVVVVNAAEDTAQHCAREHAELLAQLARAPSSTAPVARLTHCPREGWDLLLVDRASPGRALPKGQGVGLARRIGCDLALALYARGQLQTPWIHNTDADARLPTDYFQAEEVPESAVAQLFPFEHVSGENESIGRATKLYELRLRYYVASLAEAGSPYAFHSIGSTFAVRAEAYAAVRGVPRRLAGEDFYLLNKLAKVGGIYRRSGSPIRLTARASQRTPHGTGKAALAIANLPKAESMLLYNPAIFELLRIWLDRLEAFAEAPAPGLEEAVLQNAGAGALPLKSALDELGALRAAEQAARATAAGASLQRRLHTWFDGFRTLKLVHALRSRGYPSLPFRDALAQCRWFDTDAASSLGTAELRSRLAQVEARAPCLLHS